MRNKINLRSVIVLMLSVILLVLIFQTNYILKNPKEKKTNQHPLKSVEDTIKIGFSLGTLKEERWIKDRDILMAKIREMGGEIIVLNANNDDQDQLKQVKYLLEQDIDVLIMVPNDHGKAVAAVELAKKQGVKVISYDRLVLNSNVDLYISFDNIMVGRLMGEYVLNNVDNGNLLIINGATSDYNTKLIKEGYDEVLAEKIAEGSIHLITEEWASNWMKEYAFKVMDDLLQYGESIDAVIAGNDGLADGVIEALSQYRRAGETVVVGQDADLAACQRVVEGTQLMTVYKPIEKLATATARMAMQLAKGEELYNIRDRIYDGTYEIPYYSLEPIAVYKENINDTIIQDGFHRIDEVYRNLP